MFKNTSAAKETHPLPHGVTIPRSKVVVALGASSEIKERMGVDFDYNADTNESVLRDEVTFLIHQQNNQQQPE
jgi:hypothetical protein